MTLDLRQRMSRQPAATALRSGPPIFLFGLGAAKCGTTWLYDYLRGHPQCYLRGHKELHYFDKIELLKQKDEIERVEGLIEKGEQEFPGLAPAKKAEALSILLDLRDFRRVLQICHQDKNAYFRYMMTGLRMERLVADITPNYAFVSKDMLGKMVGVANETRFLYIMRDPVARIWSHVRMNVKQGFSKSEAFIDAARALMDRVLNGEEQSIVNHSDYAAVLEKMEAVIPAERRLAMFYEDLMTPAGLKKLCQFLGIKPTVTGFERVSNQGRSAEMSEDQQAALRRSMQPQYEAVASRFPVLPKAWQETMAKGFA